MSASIPGSIQAKKVTLELSRGLLKVEELNYSRDGLPVMFLGKADLNLDYTHLFRGLLEVDSLTAHNLIVNQNNIQEKKKSVWRKVLKLILSRIAVKNAELSEFTFMGRHGTVITTAKISASHNKPFFDIHHTQFKTDEVSIAHQGHSFVGDHIFFQGKTDLSFLDYDFILSKAEGTLSLKEIYYQEKKLADLHGNLFIEGNEIGFRDSTLVSPYGSFRIKGTFNRIDETAEIELKNIQRVATQNIPKLSPYIKALISEFSLDLKAEIKNFSLSEMKGEIALELKTHDNSVTPQDPEQTLNIKGTLKKGVLKLSQFKIKSLANDLDVEGKIDFDKQSFNTKVKASKIDLANLMAYFSDVLIPGSSSAEGYIQGTFKNPEFYIKNQSPKSGYSFMRFGPSSGTLTIKNQILNYQAQSHSAHENINFNLKINNLFSKESRNYQLNTLFSQVNVATLIENPYLKGNLSGSFDMNVPNSKTKKGTLSAKIDDFFFNKFHFGPVNSSGKLDGDNFILQGLQFTPPNFDTVKAASDISFKFTPEIGFTLTGRPVLGIQIKGDHQYAHPTVFNLEADLNNVDLKLLEALWEYPQYEAFVDGKIKAAFGIGPGTSHQAQFLISKFFTPLENGQIKNSGLLRFNLNGDKFDFTDAHFISNDQRFTIKGFISTLGQLNVHVLGNMNLAVLNYAKNLFREGIGTAQVDILATGTTENPQYNGSVNFLKSELSLRNVRKAFENVQGKILFKNNNLIFDQFSANTNGGDLKVKGSIGLDGFNFTRYDLQLKGNEFVLAEPGVYKVIFNGDFKVTGPVDNATLTGNADIVDGKYIEKFNLAKSILQPKSRTYSSYEPSVLDKIKLNVRVKSPGEVAIKNNLAQIFLNTDIQLIGTVGKPDFFGNVEVLDGTFKYFKVEFDNASGLINFRKEKTSIDITTVKVFERLNDIITVNAHIQGPIDNLRVIFRSDPPMERRDILALMFTGTFGEDKRRFASRDLASTVIAGQLTNLLEKPLKKFTTLDVFKLEPSDVEDDQSSTLVIGKRLTDRLTLEFKTDLNVETGQKSVQMEYLLLDNILIKGSRSTAGRYRLDVAFRWNLY